jgi:hypothetical protein
MSAASPSSEPIKAGTKRLPWIAPITTFVLAGASQGIVSFELSKWALLWALGMQRKPGIRCRTHRKRH